MDIVAQLFKGIISLSFLVFIHEFGHFIVAIKSGVKVNTFSIGFGKKIFSYTRGETEYCISAIPFGGYVAMEGENAESEEFEGGGERSFGKQSIRTRAAIALGGPLVNIVFAFIVLTFVYMAGMPEPLQKDLIIGNVEVGSAGELAGFRVNDSIIKVNSKVLENWTAFEKEIAINLDQVIKVDVRRGNGAETLNLIPSELIVKGQELGVGCAGLTPKHFVMVANKPTKGSPGEMMGFTKNDTLLRVNGLNISNAKDLIDETQASKGNEIKILVGRTTGRKEIEVSPRLDTASGRYLVGLPLTVPYVIKGHGFIDAIGVSFEKGIKYALEPFKFIYKIATGGVKLKAMSGGLGIAQVIGKSTEYGWTYFFWLMAVISMNLGIMNLLPLAVTDGGILLFLAIEAMRKKPLSQPLMLKIQKSFFYVFITLFLYITFQDVMKFSIFK